MNLYLAGPDVFRPDVMEWAKAARELCQRYGFKALLPVDHSETVPEKIFQANIALIRRAQIVVANLDPFRGAEPDSGTAFELGFAHALGKKICGYVTTRQTRRGYAPRSSMASMKFRLSSGNALEGTRSGRPSPGKRNGALA